MRTVEEMLKKESEIKAALEAGKILSAGKKQYSLIAFEKEGREEIAYLKWLNPTSEYEAQTEEYDFKYDRKLSLSFIEIRVSDEKWEIV